MNQILKPSVAQRGQRPLLSKKELADLFVVAPRTITDWLARRLVSGQRSGRTTLFPVSELPTLLRSIRIGKLPEAPFQWGSAFSTKREVAKHFSVSGRTVTNWCVMRKIPFYKFGRTVRFRIEEVEAALCYSALARFIPVNGLDFQTIEVPSVGDQSAQ